jgi:uncharacterized protein YhaN
MSGDAALRLLHLRVRRTPGILDGFAIDELSDRINIVYGPNASGKTSTARAIEAVLWPEGGTDEALGVSADYQYGERRYHVDLDAGRVSAQCDGAETQPPRLPVPALRSRYRLALHDLIVEDDAGFAREIVTQSAGGYDLRAAADACHFRGKPSSASKESKAVSAAQSQLKAAREAQVRLQAEARSLQDLESERDAAREARAREAVLALAVKHATLVASAERASAALSAFPAALEALQGDEHEELRALRNTLRDAERDTNAATKAIEDAEARMAALLPAGPPDGALLSTLRETDSLATQLDQATREHERRLADAEAQRDKARRLIGSTVSDEQLARIDSVAVGELAGFAGEVERVGAELTVADTELRHAGDGAVPRDLDVLRDGIRSLERWLSETAGDPRLDRLTSACMWVATALSILAYGVLAVRWHWAFAIGIVLAVVAGAIGARIGRSAGAREHRQAEYRRLDLPQPEAWATTRVQSLLDDLRRRLVDGLIAQQRAVWHREVAQRRNDIAARVHELDERRAPLVDRFGIAPDMQMPWLSWLVDRIAPWQDAVQLVAGASADVQRSRAQRNAAIASIADHLVAFGYSRPSSAVDVTAARTDLERRAQEYASIAHQQRSDRQRLDDLRHRHRDLEQECAEIFERAGVTSGDDRDVEVLCSQATDYVAAREGCRAAERDRDTCRRELETAPGFSPALLDRSLDDLERSRADASEQAARLEAITEEVTALRTRIEQAKAGHDAEDALAALAQADADLATARERDLRAMVGDLIVRHVQTVTRDTHRPEVFQRSRALFAEITRGRYELTVTEGEQPAFRAIDRETGLGQSLEELSNATRVQLLLAVRVAFVETQEQGMRLPLLLDEVLGTSDDTRAQAIIDAVITLAEQGRQIFYFTAQRGEVGKWKAALAQRGRECHVIDLGTVRRIEAHAGGEIEIAPVELARLPEPDGCTHEQYGAMLGVPAIRVGVTPVSRTPLWYLIDDTRALHHLRSLGISTWGALENLMGNGGSRYLADFPHQYERAAAMARALGALHEAARVGHGKPVDRAVLVESNAVSARQMEKVVAVLGACGGRANQLIEALEQGKVPGFRQNKREALRAYLEQHEYLDERPVRSPEEIQSAVLGAIANDVASGTVSPAVITELHHRIALRAKPLASAPGTPRNRAGVVQS